MTSRLLLFLVYNSSAAVLSVFGWESRQARMFNSFKMLLKPGNALLHPNLLFVDSRSSPRTLGLSTLSGPETKLRGEEVDERPQIFKVLLSASGKGKETSIHQKYRIERVIIDLLWRWRCQQFYRRHFCNRSLWRKGFFGLFSNTGSQMSVGQSLDTVFPKKSQNDFFLLDRFCCVITVYTSSHRFQSDFKVFSLPPSPPLLYSFEVTHHPTGFFLAASAPLGSHFTFIIKVMLRLPFSPSLPLSLSTDNKSCRCVSLQASCHIVCPYCLRVPVAADPGSQFISI